ncbi:MAG: O-methyltransferase [Sphingobacteriaceae bacterium]|nr:O-methyltransferase [Sphingobacteriaceae bacterium]
MEFISNELLAYSEMHSSPENELLSELNRQTHLKARMPRMLSGHLQGRLLSFLSKMQKPDCILELGTYTGYSALCLAEGLNKNGKLITIDNNPETQAIASEYFQKSIYKNQIELLTGNAAELIPTLNIKPDLIFIDADKINYSLYFDLLIDVLKSGALIIADNVLWSGKILLEKKDPDTLALHDFNTKVRQDKRVESLLLPVRDGLMLLKKV